ncbi:hypothetical protein C1931_18790 [Stenotrophomonas sp. YAU14A_MKIMI4_1]|nr:hypothetical protein C1931_18790 [Stenotrophomonas sp. YAU14A_MKIMI4_1]
MPALRALVDQQSTLPRPVPTSRRVPAPRRIPTSRRVPTSRRIPASRRVPASHRAIAAIVKRTRRALRLPEWQSPPLIPPG